MQAAVAGQHDKVVLVLLEGDDQQIVDGDVQHEGGGALARVELVVRDRTVDGGLVLRADGCAANARTRWLRPADD